MKYETGEQVYLLLDTGLIRGMVIDYIKSEKTYDVLGADNERYLIPANRLSPTLDAPPTN